MSLSWVFEQKNSLERVSLLRIICVFIALLMLNFGPYDTIYHQQMASILYRSKFPFYFDNVSTYFLWIKASTVVVGFFALFGCWTNFSLRLFTVGVCFLNYYITCYQDHYCLNQTHLNFILIALSFSVSNATFSIDALKKKSKKGTKAQEEYASWVLSFSAFFIALLLFQTGLSKLIYGGIEWFTSGDTLYVETTLDGTRLGQRLTSWNLFFPTIGVLVGFFELIFPMLIFRPEYHKLMGIILLFFHLGTYLVMGISFWFLWPLYFPLFLGVSLKNLWY